MFLRIFFSLCALCSVGFLTSCVDSNVQAPVVNGWHQPAATRSHYIVQKGDTLYSIAWAFELNFKDLARANHLSKPYVLHAGQALRMTAIPAAQSQALLATTPRHITASHARKIHASKAITRRQNSVKSNKTRPRKLVTMRSEMSHSRVKHWLWPAKGKIVRPFAGGRLSNKGIDIAGRLGEPVVASEAGEIVYAGSRLRGYGKLLLIKHNDRYISAYAHNQALLVKEGQVVKAGQTIARMGHTNTGHVLLHFEIRHNGRPVNPLRYLRRG